MDLRSTSHCLHVYQSSKAVSYNGATSIHNSSSSRDVHAARTAPPSLGLSRCSRHCPGTDHLLDLSARPSAQHAASQWYGRRVGVAKVCGIVSSIDCKLS